MRILLKLKGHDLMVIDGDKLEHRVVSSSNDHMIVSVNDGVTNCIIEFSKDSFEYIVWDSHAIHHRIDISNRDEPNTCTLIPYFSRIKD